MAARRDDELVQPILVSTAGSHEATVLAAAIASVNTWIASPENPAWGEWMAGPFAKSVRRVKPAKLRQIAAVERLTAVNVADAAAVAFPPLCYPQFPADVYRAQVSGTDFERSTPWSPLPDHLLTDPNFDTQTVLVLNPALADAMSTGKTAAQAAHALMAFILQNDPARDIPVDPATVDIYQAVSDDQFAQARDVARVVIVDHGRTEIENGSVTFLAL